MARFAKVVKGIDSHVFALEKNKMLMFEFDIIIHISVYNI
jgi:hypothetical protein